jgi:hypothetical protein
MIFIHFSAYIYTHYEKYVSGHFPLPNRIYPDNFFAVGTFPVVQQEISRQCVLLSGYFLLSEIVSGYFLLPNRKYPDNHFLLSGYFLLGNFVGIFPFGTMSGYFLLGVSGQVRSPNMLIEECKIVADIFTILIAFLQIQSSFSNNRKIAMIIS